MSAPDVTVIHAGHMLDVKTGTTLNDVSVVIAGGKIVRVGTSAEASGHNIDPSFGVTSAQSSRQTGSSIARQNTTRWLPPFRF